MHCDKRATFMPSKLFIYKIWNHLPLANYFSTHFDDIKKNVPIEGRSLTIFCCFVLFL